jgi:hypothetical protein
VCVWSLLVGYGKWPARLLERDVVLGYGGRETSRLYAGKISHSMKTSVKLYHRFSFKCLLFLADFIEN